MSTKVPARRRRPLRIASIEPLESRALFSITPFVPAFVDLTDTVVLKSSKAVKPGSGDDKVAVTVANGGNEAADGALEIELQYSTNSGGADPGLLADEEVSLDLAAGHSKTFTFSVPVAAGTPPADYFTIAVVDPENTFDESNPDNNTAITPTALQVVDPYPDMLGTLDGTYKVKSGIGKGATGTVELVVDSESDTTGDLTGTSTSDPGTEATFTGSILPDGDVSLNTADVDDDGTGLINGKFSNGKLTGTFMASDGDLSKFTATLTA